MIKVIKLIDNQCDRYLIDADCQTLGRQWDNEAEFIVVEKPVFEIQALSTCEMFVKANGQLVDVIQVYDDKPIPITSLLTQYRKITIGFSFYNSDGYVKNSEPKDFYFLEAIKPEAFTPTEPQGKDRLNYLLANGLTDLRWKEGGHNTLELVNADSEVVRELELSGFVQEQADLAESNSQSEKYVQNKSTKYLVNEGADGTSPYATEKFVESHVPDIDFSAIEQRIEEVAESVPTKTSELENNGDGTSRYATEDWVKENGGNGSEVDLKDYVKNTDYATSSTGGVVRVNSQGMQGVRMNSVGGLEVNKATDEEITAKTQLYRPIVPSNMDLAVKIGMTTNSIEWTEDEKTSARTLIDAVGNTDYAKDNKAGIVRPRLETGFFMNNDTLYIYKAKDEEIDAKTQQYRPIVPANIDYAVMKALSDCKSIEWTDEQKQSARMLLGIPTPKATQLENGSYSITFE